MEDSGVEPLYETIYGQLGHLHWCLGPFAISFVVSRVEKLRKILHGHNLEDVSAP